MSTANVSFSYNRGLWKEYLYGFIISNDSFL